MKTRISSIFLVLLATVITSIAQILLKRSSSELSLNLLALITNLNLVIGMSLYVIAGVILVLALRGGELSVLYPIIATSFVWVAFLSFLILGETISSFKIIGIIFIILGVSFIGAGSQIKSGRKIVS